MDKETSARFKDLAQRKLQFVIDGLRKVVGESVIALLQMNRGKRGRPFRYSYAGMFDVSAFRFLHLHLKKIHPQNTEGKAFFNEEERMRCWRQKWKKKVGYGRRSSVERSDSSCKSPFGGHAVSRSWRSQNTNKTWRPHAIR